MALLDQDVARNNGTPSYQQLKTAVKLQIHQIETSELGKDVVERKGISYQESKKGNKAHFERKVEECFSVVSTRTVFQKRFM